MLLCFLNFRYECTWWKLFQKHVMHIELDTYIFTTKSSYVIALNIIRKLYKCNAFMFLKFSFDITNIDTTLIISKRKFNTIKKILCINCLSEHQMNLRNCLYTEWRQAKQASQHRRLKRCATLTPPKKWGLTQVIANGKPFLFLVRHPPCYS
jgi:anaerobic ribonucleoside-triphosphate reductase